MCACVGFPRQDPCQPPRGTLGMVFDFGGSSPQGGWGGTVVCGVQKLPLSGSYPRFKFLLAFRLLYCVMDDAWYSCIMEMNYCSKCRKTQEISQFSKSKSGKNGLARWCKLCFKLYNSNRYKANPEKYRETALKWKRENLARYRELTANWRIANKSKIKQWAADNQDRLAKNSRKAYYRNVEASRLKGRIAQQRRRALVRTTQVEQITLEIWDSILKFWHGLCAYCLQPSTNLTMEHIIPLSRGGCHVVSNLVPACRRCNLSKGNKLVSEWLPTRTHRMP